MDNEKEVVIIVNTFGAGGVTKYLDKEEYEKVSQQIKLAVDSKAGKLGWKNYTFAAQSDGIRIFNEDVKKKAEKKKIIKKKKMEIKTKCL